MKVFLQKFCFPSLESGTALQGERRRCDVLFSSCTRSKHFFCLKAKISSGFQHPCLSALYLILFLTVMRRNATTLTVLLCKGELRGFQVGADL